MSALSFIYASKSVRGGGGGGDGEQSRGTGRQKVAKGQRLLPPPARSERRRRRAGLMRGWKREGGRASKE